MSFDQLFQVVCSQFDVCRFADCRNNRNAFRAGS
jgi:hypothetical protein